jgi:hypothetical protein
MLFDYARQVRRFLRDPKMGHIDEPDIWSYVNRARREVALRSQSIRRVPPTSGAIVEIDILNPGVGYQNPVVVISPPDSPNGQLPYPGGAQATAVAQALPITSTSGGLFTLGGSVFGGPDPFGLGGGPATLAGGELTNVSVTFGGAGYFQPTAKVIDFATPEGANVFILGTSILGGPDVLGATASPPVADGLGTGAVLSVQIEPLSITAFQQETYAFEDFPIQTLPGIKSVFAVLNVSIIYSNYRYSLPYYPFSVYQAFIRQYPRQYLYVPTMYTQLQQGSTGSLLFYPIPNTAYQFDVDALCLPADLESDESPEALPEPWTDSVPWVAAALCYEEIQNLNSARYYREMFNDYSHKYSAWTRPSRINNIYGRY